jgi:hypothetical protein
MIHTAYLLSTRFRRLHTRRLKQTMSLFSVDGRRLIRCLVLMPALTACALSHPSAILAQLGTQRLPREDLLLYVDARGCNMRAETPEQWQRRRAAILAGMQQVMGDLPDEQRRCDLKMVVQEEADCGSYLRRLVTYQSEPGSRVPAYLLIPKSLLSENLVAPAVLCLHPTDNQLGHKVVVGLGGRANRQYAEELAERGYVTLAPSYPLLANYQPELKAAGYKSGTMKAVWDNIRGVDLLRSLPFVKKDAIGAIGHSLGGHNAVFTAVFDERIRVIVSSCGLDSFLDYKNGDITGWTSSRYMPRLGNYRSRLEEIPFDFHELVAALAPRHCLISAPMRDDNFQWDSVRRIGQAARQVYELYGVAPRLRILHPPCDHDFPPEIREEAYRLFDRVLRGVCQEE